MFNNAGILGSVGPITDIGAAGYALLMSYSAMCFMGLSMLRGSCKIKDSAQSSMLLQLLEFEQVWAPRLYRS